MRQHGLAMAGGAAVATAHDRSSNAAAHFHPPTKAVAASSDPCAGIANPNEYKSCQEAMRQHGLAMAGGAAVTATALPASNSAFAQGECFETTGSMNLGVCNATWGGRKAIVKYVERSTFVGVTAEKEIALLRTVVNACGIEADRRSGCKHVVTIFDVVAGPNDSVGIVMKYLNGGNLKTHVVGSAEHPPTAVHVVRRLTYIEEVFTGLQFLHANRIIHCDIKPDNIMLHSTSGRLEDAYAVITDMGIAVLKGEPIVGCYPAFGIYPREHPADEKQDYYALVMTFYCLYHYDIHKYIQNLQDDGASRATIDKNIRERFPSLAHDANTLEKKIPGFSFRLAAFGE
jgi:serine/threonine protein kinase